MLKKINADREGSNVQNVEVLDTLHRRWRQVQRPSGKQPSERIREVVKNQLKKTKVEANIDAHYTAQDWDGFQRLVQASNLQDKDVILRVLSMYKDPQEREEQIRNMSAGFQNSPTASSPNSVVHALSSTTRQSDAATTRSRHSMQRTLPS